MAEQRSQASRIRVGTILHGDKIETIPVLARHGFESVGLYLLGDAAKGLDWKSTAERIEQLIGDSDIVVSSISVYLNSLTDPDARSVWESAIDGAPLFGCDLVAGLTGRIVDRPIEESLPAFTGLFRDLAKRAADNDVRIAFENWNGNGNWWWGDWNIAHHPKAWELIFDALPYKSVGLQWEPCHQMMLLVDPVEQLRDWAPKVFNIHGKDAEISWEDVRRHGVDGSHPYARPRTPSYGDLNWRSIFEILTGAGYSGSIDIEGFHDEQHGADKEFASQLNALEYLKICRGDIDAANPWE